MKHIEILERKVRWAERKANEAAASNEPWALGNLRLYQNMMVRFLDELQAARRTEMSPTVCRVMKQFESGLMRRRYFERLEKPAKH